jgi:hypothetical protein
MLQKIKHTKKYNSIVVLGLTILMIACGTAATDGFVSDEKLLKGSAFDDSQSSSSQGNLSLRVRCEIRSNRSKVSVDATDIASGEYKATVTSGGVEVTSGTANSVGDEVEFDFDSDGGDIAEGATAINSNFIQGGKVTGKIYTVRGDFIAGLENVTCENK